MVFSPTPFAFNPTELGKIIRGTVLLREFKDSVVLEDDGYSTSIYLMESPIS